MGFRRRCWWAWTVVVVLCLLIAVSAGAGGWRGRVTNYYAVLLDPTIKGDPTPQQELDALLGTLRSMQNITVSVRALRRMQRLSTHAAVLEIRWKGETISRIGLVP